MKIRTKDLTGATLDWAVAKCEWDVLAALNIQYPQHAQYFPKVSPSTDWAQGGPIVERERITIRYWANTPSIHAYMPAAGSTWYEGETALIAAMRCYVASKLGDEIDVPEELT